MACEPRYAHFRTLCNKHGLHLRMPKPAKNHPWKLGLSGPVSYANRSNSNWRGFYRPPEDASPVRTLSEAMSAFTYYPPAVRPSMTLTKFLGGQERIGNG